VIVVVVFDYEDTQMLAPDREYLTDVQWRCSSCYILSQLVILVAVPVNFNEIHFCF
jgi:hypothetical protein